MVNLVILSFIGFLINQEYIYIESSGFFLAFMGFFVMWYLYELGIKDFEENFNMQSEIIEDQFVEILEVNLVIVMWVKESLQEKKIIFLNLFEKGSCIIEKISKAIQLSFRSISNFLNLCSAAVFQFVYDEKGYTKKFFSQKVVYNLTF